MSKPPMCRLPSGRVVPLTRTSDPARPWEVWDHQGHYVLSRPRRGDSSSIEQYSTDRLGALLLDKADAEALLAALTAHVGKRTSVRA